MQTISVYQLIYTTPLSSSLELLVVTKMIRSLTEAAEMSFLSEAAGSTLNDRMRKNPSTEPLLINGIQPGPYWIPSFCPSSTSKLE